MTVKELNRDQLIELKTTYYMNKHENVSWGELANIDELVSDEEVYNGYDYITFTEDDFLCRCGLS